MDEYSFNKEMNRLMYLSEIEGLYVYKEKGNIF
jgi:hypothetical protein